MEIMSSACGAEVARDSPDHLNYLLNKSSGSARQEKLLHLIREYVTWWVLTEVIRQCSAEIQSHRIGLVSSMKVRQPALYARCHTSAI